MENTQWKSFSVGVLTAQPMNPWRTIWNQPRETVRQLVLEGQDGRLFVLAALAGVAQVLDRASSRDMGDQLGLSGILLLAVLVGPVAGIGGVYFWSWLTSVTGRWLGGSADADSIRIPIAWGSVPAVSGLALWCVALLLLGSDLFTAETPRIDANPLLALSLIPLVLGWLVLGVWSVVLMAKGVAEVQGFHSAWRGFGNLVLGGVVFLGAVLVLVVAIVAVAR